MKIYIIFDKELQKRSAKAAYLSNSSLRSSMHIYARISKDQLPCCSVTAGGTTEGDRHAMVRQLHITYSTLLNHRALIVTWNWFSNCFLFGPLHSLWNMITWPANTACPAQTQYVENRMEVRIECNIKIKIKKYTSFRIWRSKLSWYVIK